MCYRVYHHRQPCDTRPIISDGRTLFYNPFATPKACACEQDESIRTWFRCPTHKCCWLVGSLYRCPSHATCGPPQQYHNYEEDVELRYGRYVGGKTQPLWPVVPSIDEGGFLHHDSNTVPAESPAFRRCLSQLLAQCIDMHEIQQEARKNSRRMNDEIRRFQIAPAGANTVGCFRDEHNFLEAMEGYGSRAKVLYALFKDRLDEIIESKVTLWDLEIWGNRAVVPGPSPLGVLAGLKDQ